MRKIVKNFIYVLVCFMFIGNINLVFASDVPITNGSNDSPVEEDVPKISILVESNKVKVGKKMRINVVGGTGKYTFTSSNPNVAIINQNGVITGKNVGVAKITVKSGSRKVSKKIRVIKNTLKISGYSKVQKGTRVKYTASTSNVRWSVNNTNIANINQNGVLRAKKKGTVIITARSGNLVANKRVKIETGAPITNETNTSPIY